MQNLGDQTKSIMVFSQVAYSLPDIGLNYTAAMFSPEGLKTFVFSHPNSFPLEARGTKSIVYGQLVSPN